MQFKWEGVLQSGESTKGLIHADTIAQARIQLRKQGIITRKLAKSHRASWVHYNRRIKTADITLFSRQMATLLKSGVPLIQSFKIIENGTDNPVLRRLIESIRTDIGTGLMFAHALNKHPSFFNALFCNMISVGEQSGSLDVMLDKVATYKEKIARIKKKINKALAYPAAVSLIAILVTCGLLTFVIPQFESLFKGFNAELPLMTRYVIHLSDFFKTWWPSGLLITIVTVYGIVYAHKHVEQFAKLNHHFILSVPVIGRIIKHVSIARFARTLAITFAAGLPLTDALKLIASATGNHQYTLATYKIREAISQGQSLQQAIQNTQLFPSLVIQLIAIGEESGSLEHMLSKIAGFYEEEVDNTIDAISGLLEPVIMTILGLLVGCLIIAMYLPILKLGSVV